MVSKVLFQSRSEEWGTPQKLFDYLNDIYHFTLDPCASFDNHKCDRYYTKEDDRLSIAWDDEVVFMNPPYGRDIGKWMKKAVTSTWTSSSTVVCLVPVRTDTAWWQDWVQHAAEIWFIEGRLRFDGGQHSATFPSAIVVFKKERNGWLQVKFLKKMFWMGGYYAKEV